MDTLPSWITSGAYLVVAITTVVAIILEFRRYHNQILRQNNEHLLLENKDRRDAAELRQSQDKLSIERRRLVEANVSIEHTVRLTHAHSQPPFVIFQADVENIGDGPIDMWATLVSARMLSEEFRPGVGRRGRDVTWSDYEQFFWNDQRNPVLFSGLSTTKNMIASPNHFLRFVAKERSALRRIDAVSAPDLLGAKAPLYLMYRMFTVLRGYPLGEILRQVGGGLPDPLLTVPIEQLQFRSLAQPTYASWQRVQEALSNLTRLAFRLAISGDDPHHDPLGSKDPLGLIAEPDAWRFFLLHHHEFSGHCCTSAAGQQVTMDAFSNELVAQYFEGQLPIDILAHPNYEQARRYCQEHLIAMVTSWRTLQTVIRECTDYPLNGYTYGENGMITNQVTPPGECATDGYSIRIHTDGTYRDRWLDLLVDGYLLSRPLPRAEMAGKAVKYDARDIPADPRFLEPFVMRTYYFLETVPHEATAG